MKRHTGLLLSVVSGLVAVWLLTFTHDALAKGDFARIVISGGGLAEPLEVTDPTLLPFSSLSQFPQMQIPQPPVQGEGYAIARHFDNQPSAWDRLRYYPNTSGVGGYILYEGLVNGHSEYDGKWYTVSATGDEALRRILADQQVTPFATNQSYSLVLVIGLMTLAILGFEFYQRVRHRDPLTDAPIF